MSLKIKKQVEHCQTCEIYYTLYKICWMFQSSSWRFTSQSALVDTLISSLSGQTKDWQDMKRLNYLLTSTGGSSRTGLRHIDETLWGSTQCWCLCCTCSVDKKRASVSTAVNPGPFTHRWTKFIHEFGFLFVLKRDYLIPSIILKRKQTARQFTERRNGAGWNKGQEGIYFFL